MAMPKTVITGCELEVPQEGRWLHGDLWALEGCWIFNGVADSKGEAAWVYQKPPYLRDDSKSLIITGNYFERRSVVVISKNCAYLNRAAADYLRKWGY